MVNENRKSFASVIRQEKSFFVFLFLILCFEVYVQIFYSPYKGDVFSLNFATRELLALTEKDGFLSFLNHVFLHRPDKGTILPLLQLPFLVMGLSSLFSNQLICIAFSTLFFGCCFQFFRREAGFWLAVCGTLGLVSCEFVFKNINEFETYLIFVSSLSAVFFLGLREQKAPTKWGLNSFLLIVFLVLCIGSRPFESFWVAFGIWLFDRSRLKSKKFLLGFSLGGLWWLLDFDRFSLYWHSTNQQTFGLTFSRLLNPFFCGLVLLALSVVFKQIPKRFWSKELSARVVIFIAIGPVLTLSVLGVLQDDYILMSYLLICFFLMRFIFRFERANPFPWRSIALGLLVSIFFVDQGIALQKGRGPLGWARTNFQSESFLETWHQLRPFFKAEEVSRVAVIFAHSPKTKTEIDVAWGLLGDLSNKEGYRVWFSYPEPPATSTDRAPVDFCSEKITFLLVIDGSQKADDSDLAYQYLNRSLPSDFTRNLTLMGQAHWDGDASIGLKPLDFRLFKMNCATEP